MIIFPAIDIKGGFCVRLQQGDPRKETIYSRDPVRMAKHWEREGAEWLHVIDLDGAFSGIPKNYQIIYSIAASVSIPVQVGGGIRTMETIRAYLDHGVERVIIGTAAFFEPELIEKACTLYPGRVAVAIDARDGKIAIEGWQEMTNTDAVELASRFDSLNLAAIIYTDIYRDGMESGVNMRATRRLVEEINTPVIASGGVAGLDDILSLLPMEPLGLQGVIVGKALYSGAFKLGDVLKKMRGLKPGC